MPLCGSQRAPSLGPQASAGSQSHKVVPTGCPVYVPAAIRVNRILANRQNPGGGRQILQRGTCRVSPCAVIIQLLAGLGSISLILRDPAFLAADPAAISHDDPRSVTAKHPCLLAPGAGEPVKRPTRSTARLGQALMAPAEDLLATESSLALSEVRPTSPGWSCTRLHSYWEQWPMHTATACCA